MNNESLSKVFSLVKNMNESCLSDASTNQDQTMTIDLTMRIAKACEQDSEFIAAVVDHRYPPIRLTQKEAEFLKAGNLCEILSTEPEIFDLI